LGGAAMNEAEKSLAGELAVNIKGVTRVINDMTIADKAVNDSGSQASQSPTLCNDCGTVADLSRSFKDK
jgi:hypothetical protein